MKQNRLIKSILVPGVFFGWIIFVLFIFERFVMIDESELEYITHDVPGLYMNPLGMEFVYIKPGQFLMGNDGGYKNKVFITNGFYIQKTEVTQSQWKSVLGYNPSKFKDCGDECPVEMISKDDAKSFIRELNSKNLKDAFRYRLPTEAEWEYAVTLGDNLYFEDAKSFMEQLSEYSWYSENSLKTPHPVAEKKPNRLGIYDLRGNVHEWCADHFTTYPRKKISKNPLNTYNDRSGNHSVRGGSWRSFYYYCRKGTGTGRLPGSKHNDVGMRLIIEIKN